MKNKEKVPGVIKVFGKGYGALFLGLLFILFPFASIWIGGGVDFSDPGALFGALFFIISGAFMFVVNVIYLKKYR